MALELPFRSESTSRLQSSPLFWRGPMAGKRLAILALALLAGCGRDQGGAPTTDDPTRDLQRPGVDASSPLNDRAADSPTKLPSKVAAKPAAKPVSKTTTKSAAAMLSPGTAISAKFDA